MPSVSRQHSSIILGPPYQELMDDHKLDVAEPHAERSEMANIDVTGKMAEEAYGNEIDPAAEKRVLRKMDRALIPLVTALCELMIFFSRRSELSILILEQTSSLS